MASTLVTPSHRRTGARRGAHKDFYDYYGNFPVGAYRVTPAGRVVAANDALLRMLGFASLEALRAVPLATLRQLPNESWDVIRSRMRSEGQVRGIQAIWLRRGGPPVITRENMWAIGGDDGTPVYFESNVTDITGRKADEALRVFRVLYDAFPVGLAQIGLDGRLLQTNQAFLDLLGYDHAQLERLTLEALVAPDESGRATEAFRRVAAGEQDHSRAERSYVRRDGINVWALETLSVVRDAHRTPRFVSAVVEDISERKAAEQRLLHRTSELEAANQELESFAHTVSHDLRTPLRAIASYSQILVDEHEKALSQEAQRLLGRVADATHRMSDLIDDLLRFSRVTRTELKRERVDLTKLVREVARDLRRRNGRRRVAFVIQPGLAAEGDAQLLRVALENLLENAWKFTGKVPRARVEFGRTATPQGAAFFVRDNGAGFDMAFKSKLFQPFERLHNPTEFEGTGIGLATVSRIIRRHGGRCWADGKIGRGATIYFTV